MENIDRPSVTITVDCNSDEVRIACSTELYAQTIKLPKGMRDLERLLEDVLNMSLLPEAYVRLERVDEDTLRCVEEW